MRIGEVIETSTVAFLAQSHELHQLPPLGSLVAVAGGEGERTIYAVVAFGETASIDAGRRPVRRGDERVYDQAIYHEHPELALILRTVFQARVVGFADGRRQYRYLPPMPPPLHYSVRSTEVNELREFTNDLLYLRILLTGEAEVSAEQLLAAHIRSVYATRREDRRWLEAASREVARLFKDDYDRLLTVLQSIDPAALPAGGNGLAHTERLSDPN